MVCRFNCVERPSDPFLMVIVYGIVKFSVIVEKYYFGLSKTPGIIWKKKQRHFSGLGFLLWSKWSRFNGREKSPPIKLNKSVCSYFSLCSDSWRKPSLTFRRPWTPRSMPSPLSVEVTSGTNSTRSRDCCRGNLLMSATRESQPNVTPEESTSVKTCLPRKLWSVTLAVLIKKNVVSKLHFASKKDKLYTLFM